jgi:predicted permease
MARWSIAQPLLVARGDGVMASLGESWDRTKGNELSIFTAALAVLLVPIVVMIAAGVLFAPENLVGIVIAQLATSALSLILLAMGVALYGLIMGRDGVAAPSA